MKDFHIKRINNLNSDLNIFNEVIQFKDYNEN